MVCSFAAVLLLALIAVELLHRNVRLSYFLSETTMLCAHPTPVRTELLGLRFGLILL